MFASLVLATVAASSSASCPSSLAMFSDMRARSGGAQWSATKELIARGQAAGAGLTGSTTIAIDLQNGANSTTDVDPEFRQQVVIAPGVTWKQDFTLGVHRVNSPDALAANLTSRYLARRGYFQPSDPAAIGCAADEIENGRVLKRLQIVPKGGRPVTLWIDPQLPAIVRSQEQAPTHLSTVEYADFRNTQGLLLPFKITESDDRPEDTTVRTIASYDVLQLPKAADFQPPPAPANQRISGSNATQMDLDVESGSPVVNAYVNGKGPLPFILDTGGHAILTADAARQLGIAGTGQGVSGGAGEGTISLQFGRLQSLKLGDAELTDLAVLIIPYDKSFSDRGPGKTPLAGILGLEIFERFVVTVDYAHGKLTLQTPQSYSPPAGQRALPIVFQDDEPLTTASADGIPGLFGIDTGNSGRTVLFGDFLRNHGFLTRYSGGAATQGFGTGGAVYSTSFRLRELTFGGLTMHDFVTSFVSQKSGSFSSRTEAGNIGHDVLAQFTITFDYSRGRMYVRPEPGAPLPSFSRAGFTSFGRNSTTNNLIVQGVLPNTPAGEAGFAAGDSITAIDGVPVAGISNSRLRELTRQPAGTQLHLTVVKSSGATSEVTLTLRDLLCNDGKTTCPPRVTPASE